MDMIYFGGSAAAGIIGWATIFATIIWPKMKRQPRPQQLKTLTAIHFFRYFATTLLIAGLVSRKLPSGFADPAAFGDLISLGLAYIAFIGLQRSKADKPLLFPVWIFNIVGAADLLLAMVLGPTLIHDPGDFGLAYIIPTVYVPLLLVAHFYALKVLSQRSSEKSVAIHQGPHGMGWLTGKLPSPPATVEILEGFRQRTEGQVSVLGHDPATAGGAWRDRVGVVMQESEPEPGLSVRECLAMYAGFYRAPRDIDETIALVGLTEKAGALATRLSGGQRRRLDFALIGDPELIFLDEPTTGFDPSARRAAWEVVAGLRQLGKTVFLTTHYMDEAEYLADRIAVLSAGHIVAEGTPATLGGRDHMTTAISFTLPDHVQARDLPPGLKEKA